MPSDVVALPSDRPRLPGGRVVPLLALVGGLSALLLSRQAPIDPGAARLAAPDVLLALFDVLVLVALAWPSPHGGRHAVVRAVAIFLVAAPFHAALAAAAGGGAGHGGGLALAAAAFGGAGALGATGRRGHHVAALAALSLGVPLLAYALTEFVRLDALAALRASPVLLPVLLAGSAATTPVTAALPAILGAALLVLAAKARLPHRRRGAATALCVAALVGSGVARADEPPVEVLFDGVVRDGGPVTLRVASIPDRVRAGGSPWVRPRGRNGDEYVLPGVVLRGDRLVVELDHEGTVTSQTLDVDLRAPSPAGAFVAAPGSEADGAGDVALGVRGAHGLSTVPEAWRLFTGLDLSRAPALDSGVRTAAEEGVRARVLDPWRLAPGVEPFRAMQSVDERAPRLPSDVAWTLSALALVTLASSLLLRTRRERPVIALAWLAVPALGLLAWLVLADRLPGPLRATALVLCDDVDRVVIVRVTAARDGSAEIVVPEGAAAPTFLRLEPADGSESGLELGRTARLALPAGAFRLIAYSAPGGSPASIPAGERSVSPPAALAGWLRRAGLRVTGLDEAADAALPSGRGLRVVSAGAFAVAPTRK